MNRFETFRGWRYVRSESDRHKSISDRLSGLFGFPELFLCRLLYSSLTVRRLDAKTCSASVCQIDSMKNTILPYSLPTKMSRYFCCLHKWHTETHTHTINKKFDSKHKNRILSTYTLDTGPFHVWQHFDREYLSCHSVQRLTQSAS